MSSHVLALGTPWSGVPALVLPAWRPEILARHGGVGSEQPGEFEPPWPVLNRSPLGELLRHPAVINPHFLSRCSTSC